MPIRYVFKDKPITLMNADTADPQRIGEALAEIKEQTNGRCNSKTILDAARDRDSYLHQFFEWRDTIAAEKYRQGQARELVACLNIVEGKGKRERRLPAFISLVDEKTGRGYHSVREVMDSASLSALALRQVESEMLAMENRLLQFGEICNAIRHARELIAARRRQYEEAHPEHA